ncbi:hypothetical protein Cpha266_2188 [Chlorobium phaeobacteroides DSM 266]|uniref:Uncharacterized protein n=1 Tax=Chlorobium phaeobacteroides (strain DSM 266 / SMG 266 / 2430) TaxID=290317 RepID=A1BIG4_CHLPD|nr:hypothetical protein Cpha266_2188 [Chlorobium phaeobacteroides DSM 266]
MPRGPGFDSPGTLHHVIIRGIEKREIVADERSGNIRIRNGVGCRGGVGDMAGRVFCLCRLNLALY